MMDFLIQYDNYILMGHVFFMAIGLGGATITDFLFFRFLRDGQISEMEAKVMNMLSQVIWLALALIVITGLALYLPQFQALHDSAKFVAKMTIIFVLILNGIALNVWAGPKLHEIFGSSFNILDKKLRLKRKIAFALGAISMVSWYSAFFLGAVRGLKVSYEQLILTYLVLILFAVVGSQIFESLFSRKVFIKK